MANRRELLTGIGAQVASLRKQREMTQAALASRSGVSPRMVSLIETGNVSPSITTLDDIASALRVPLAKLLPSPVELLDPVTLLKDCTPEEQQRVALLIKALKAVLPAS